MKTNHLAVAALAAAVSLSLGSGARAQERPVPLGFGVPDGSHVVIHGRTSATPDPAMLRMENAIRHLVDSRVHEDILELATMEMSRRQADEVRGGVLHGLDVLGRADWGALMSTEIVFAERIMLPIPEYLMIFRVPADQAEQHLAGIKSMLSGFAEMIGSPVAAVRDVTHRNGPIVELAFDGAPIQIAAGMVGDAIVLSTSTRTTIASMRGLLGDGSGSIVENERFKRSSVLVPPGSESTTFIDMAGLFGFIEQVMGMAEMGTGGDERAAAVLDLVRTVLEELDILDHMVVSATSDGTTVTNTAILQMRDGYESSRFVKLCANQQPWTDWYRFVPADATSFVFDSGVDIGGLFDLVEALAAESFGDGQRAPWSDHPMYKSVRDHAGYVSGELACVTFPANNAMSCDSVFLLRLESTDGVSDWLGAHLRWIARFLETRGQSMTVTSDGGLHTVELAAFPWIRPAIGVHGDMIVAATSPEAIARMHRVHDGQEPNIRSSERFASLGIGGEGAGHYIDYAQLETGMGEFANCMSAAGFVMSILPMDRDTRPLIKVGAILTKLAPAMRELDMAFDYGVDMRAAQAPGAFLSRSVYRYRDSR